jgi:hypothetical protein
VERCQGLDAAEGREVAELSLLLDFSRSILSAGWPIRPESSRILCLAK